MTIWGLPPESPDQRRAMWSWRQTRMAVAAGLPAREDMYRKAIAAGEWYDAESEDTDLDARHLFSTWLRRSERIEEANQHLEDIAAEGAQRLRLVRDVMAAEYKVYRYSYREQSARRGVWLSAQEELAHVLAAQGRLEAAARWWRIASEDPWCPLDLRLPRAVTHAPGEDAMEYEDYVRVSRVADSAIRSALQETGLDVAPDLQDPEVPDATVAGGHRVLSGDPLWLALWSAAEETDLHAAGLERRTSRDAAPWQGPWAQLWDLVSPTAWDAAQGAALDVAGRLGPRGNLEGALRLLFKQTERHCTHQLVSLYAELVKSP